MTLKTHLIKMRKCDIITNGTTLNTRNYSFLMLFSSFQPDLGQGSRNKTDEELDQVKYHLIHLIIKHRLTVNSRHQQESI